MPTFSGTSKDNKLNGTDGDDTFLVSSGNDSIFARLGRDTLVFDGYSWEFDFSAKPAGGSFNVSYDHSIPDVQAYGIANGVEKLAFKNGAINLDKTEPDTINYEPTIKVEIPSKYYQISENEPLGSVIATFAVTDPEGNSFSLDITDDQGGIYTIIKNTIVLTGKPSPDKSLSAGFRLTATDSLGNRAAYQTSIELNYASATVSGTEKDDYLYGGMGADTISGGIGRDSLMGGEGSDTFKFNSAKEIGKGGNPWPWGDQIVDFNSFSDLIDLSVIDANTRKAGDQAFNLVSRLTGRAGQLDILHSKDWGTIVRGDINGDGKADFNLSVQSGSQYDAELDAGSFVF